jgi:HK97 family phage major capsid protein/HK97 family phage prohead protease
VDPRRAYSTFEVKAIDDDERVIEGIASTPSADRIGDVMEPKGAKFTLPLPLLWQHDQQQPIGEVFDSKVSGDGIRIKARFAKLTEPGRLKDRLDEAWQSVRAKLVRGLSIGWTPIEAAFNKETGGLHVLEWHWAELSVVTIPMNVEATILKIKELDLAASGRHTPGASGTLPIVRAVKAAPAMNVAEQITSFESKRAASVARMTALMTDSAGATLDDKQTEEYTNLEREVAAIDAHLPRLKSLEKTLATTAVPADGTSPAAAAASRGALPSISIKGPDLPKGTAFVRYICAKVNGKSSRADAIAFAESRKDWQEQTPEVALALKAAVNPGTISEPAWAAPLAVVQPMVNEFLEILRPATIIGRINGLRRVPFNISVPIQTGGGTYNWVGEGAPKPVGNLQLTSATLGIAKAAGIIVISKELAKLSNPSAEGIIRADMVGGMAQYLDQQFIDPTVAPVTNVSPGSITNGAVSIGSAGATAANFETDLKALISSLIGVNQAVTGLVLIMSQTNALALSMARTTNGDRYFPELTMAGGTIAGIQVITSEAAGITVTLLVPSEILLADEGGVEIDVSEQASVEMNTAPTSPVAAATVLISLWQHNLVGLRADRWINWKRARLQAVRYTNRAYTG